MRREGALLVLGVVSAASCWAAAGQAVSTQPLRWTTGSVRFTPLRDEAELPGLYRLSESTFSYEMACVETGAQMDVHVVRFPSPVQSPHPENNTVHAEYYQPKGRAGPRPGVVMLHILDGRFREARLFSRALALRGAAVLFVKMAYYGPRRPPGSTLRLLSRDVPHLVQAVRQTVLDIRWAGAWLRARPEVDPNRLAVAGVSLGGIMAALAGAIETRFARVEALLAGGDFVRLLYDSPAAQPLRQEWESRGGTRESLQQLVRDVDPVTHAGRLRGRQVWMASAARDEIVPPACAEALWEAAGRPPIVWLDCTHTGALAFLVPLVDTVARHLAEWQPVVETTVAPTGAGQP